MSLWKGTIVSHGAWDVELGIVDGIMESVDNGHASPREVESITVREEGQTGARPFMRRFQSVGRGTIGTEAA